MGFKKEKMGKFVKGLCYFWLYIVVGIWIISSLFFSKSLDKNYTFIVTLKIIDHWIVWSPIVSLVPLMFIQIYEENKLRKSNSTKLLDIKETILIIGFIIASLIKVMLPYFSQLKIGFVVVMWIMMVYTFVILPILWIKKNGYKKAIVLILTVLSLISINYLNTGYNQDLKNSFNIIITILEQLYLYFLVEFFLKKKKTIKKFNQLIIFLIITIDIRIVLNAIIWEKKPEVLSKEIIIKLITAIIFYFIKECLWNPKNNVKKILETQTNLIITEKPETWKKLKDSFKRLKKKDKKMYKNMTFKFLEYESCLLDQNDEKFKPSEILLPICEYNRLFKNENIRIFVFDVDNSEVKKRFEDKLNDSNYCELANNVYIISYSININNETRNKKFSNIFKNIKIKISNFINKNSNKKIQENNNKEFFDILNKIFEEKNNQTQNTKPTEGGK